MIDKQRIAKMQKKLEQRKLTVYEALQEQITVQWLKTSNPAFYSMLTADTTIQIINLLIIPGPPQDKSRSFKVPMIAADLLSTMVPKVYELFFLQDPEDKTQVVLSRLLRYFDTSPNYVISGYVVRILMNLIPANPLRVIQYIYKSHPEKMLNFLESQSVSEFLLRIIIVQDALLNVQIKQRIKLFDQIVKLYINNKSDEEILVNANWILNEAILRLWAQKHKEMGRFASSIFKLIQSLIDNNNLYQQETLIVSISKQVSLYIKEAPFVIAALYKKIQQELTIGKIEATPATTTKIQQPRLSIKRYKYLQALFYIISHGAQAIAKQLSSSNVFYTLLDFITRYQWHSLALVQIQKTIKAAVNSHSQVLFNALNRSYFLQKLQQLVRLQAVYNKFGYGFSGLLHSVIKTLKESIDANAGYGAFLRKNHRDGDVKIWVNEYLSRQKNTGQNVRVVHQVAKPFYSISKLPELFSQFFEETQQINARLQSQSPSKHQVEEKQVLQQIENQNQLVYKLLSQLVSQAVPDEKKPESESIE